MDYYEILQVRSTASPSQIRSAYRTLALKYHPDKNPKSGTTDKFKEILAAYKVLSDKKKRALFDQEDKARQTRKREETKKKRREETERCTQEAENVWKEKNEVPPFKSNPNSSFLPSYRRTRFGEEPKGEDIVYCVNATLEDLYGGKTGAAIVITNVVCWCSQGPGTRESDAIKCLQCTGSGTVWQATATPEPPLSSGCPRLQQPHSCRECAGTGYAREAMQASVAGCWRCGGHRVFKKVKSLQVCMEPGMRDGDTITLRGEGNQVPGSPRPPGNVVFVISQSQGHPVFQLLPHTDHLFTTLQISPDEARQGFTRTITTLDGRELPVNSSGNGSGGGDGGGDGGSNYYYFLVPNEGFPNRNDQSKKGDLIVFCEVK